MEKLLSWAFVFSALLKKARITAASAALSYYLTMTVFPLLICIYTMLGNSYETVISLTRLASGLVAPDILSLVEDFLGYVSASDSRALLVAGLLLLVSYASAAVRSIHATLSGMQGGCKYEGILRYAASIVFSLVFLAAIYFAVIVMLTGRRFIEMINELFPALSISAAWVVVRFVVLAGIFYSVIRGIYEAPKRPQDKYSTHPGALAAAAASLVVTLAFSWFIGRSANYPLVYGSLASLVLLMLWLYSVCIVIYLGAALNIALGGNTHDLAATDPSPT